LQTSGAVRRENENLYPLFENRIRNLVGWVERSDTHPESPKQKRRPELGGVWIRSAEVVER
jgi:hypothetical protein